MRKMFQMVVQNKHKFTGLFLVALSGFAGFAGYAFNLIVAKFFGPLTLGQLLASINVFSFISLPAMLFMLPIAKLSIQEEHWQEKIKKVRFHVLIWTTLCAVVIYLCNPLLEGTFGIPKTWLVPLLIWTIASYVHAVQVGVLMGRRTYVMMGIITAIPVVGKLVFLIPLLYVENVDPEVVLWTIGISSSIAAIAGYFGVKRISHSTEYSEMPKDLFASSFVTLTINCWMTLDIVIAGLILAPSELAIYAIISTLGKIPFQLSNVLANIGISETAWERGRKYKTGMVIGGLGLICVVFSAVFGDFLLSMFHLSEGLYPLLLFMVSSTVLAYLYFDIGADAQKGVHSWWPSAVCLTLGIIASFVLASTATDIVIILGTSQIIALFSTIVYRWVKHKSTTQNAVESFT